MIFDPLSNLKQFGLKATDEVADLGAGSGAYTIPLAQIIRDGKVYAVEVQKDFLPRIAAEAKQAHLSNVETIWGDIENLHGTKLKDDLVDVVLIANVLFQVSNKVGLIMEAKRILKPGGRLFLIDWKDSFGGLGPRGDMIIGREAAQNLFEKQGFKYEKEISVGEHHYGLEFSK